MSQKKLQPAGFYDITPDTMLKREYLVEILKSTFKQYGFLPMETPAIERLDVLSGKYGQEGDQLLFKILNSGDFFAKTTEEDYRQGAYAMLAKIAKKGLRYDLTVPLARYIATHKNQITFPFKRFQIQPVWRAEKPQKNRYREFYQCDVDIIGSSTLLCEAEILAMVAQVVERLALKQVCVQVNHRAIFSVLTKQLNLPEKDTLLCRILDKLDKIGEEKVVDLLLKQGFSSVQIKKIAWLFTLQGPLQETLPTLAKHMQATPEAQKIVREFEKLLYYTQALKIPSTFLTLTPTLARGMDYYTGLIFELRAKEVSTSLGGGGRYDRLTTRFGTEDLAGIGFSFGLDRLYNLLEQHSLIPAKELKVTSLLLVPLTQQEESTALDYLCTLRKAKIPSESYPIGARLQKAFVYATKKNIPWVAVIGENEVQNKCLSLKHLATQEKSICTLDEIIHRIRKA